MRSSSHEMTHVLLTIAVARPLAGIVLEREREAEVRSGVPVMSLTVPARLERPPHKSLPC